MKKLLVAFLATVMSLSLMGCGGDDAPASAPTNNPQANEVSAEEQVAQEQALADADYNKLVDLAGIVAEHYALSDEMAALLEKVRAGEAEESSLLDASKQLADHSQALLEAVENAQWQTEYYKDHIALLTDAVKALAEGERLNYEAGVENDESKLAEVEKLLEEFNVKADQFLDMMGV